MFKTGNPAYFESYIPILKEWFGIVVGALEEDGEINSVALLTRNITKQKKAEDALKISELRYRQMMNLAPVGMFETDKEGMVSYVNQAVCRFTGIAPVAHFGANWLGSVHPDDREKMTVYHQRRRQEDADPPNVYEFRFLRALPQLPRCGTGLLRYRRPFRLHK